MKDEFSHIRSRWHRFVITILVRYFVWRDKLRSPRAFVHWIGRHNRPRRHERALFVFLFFGSMLLMSARQFLYWSTLWGGMMAIFLNLYTIYRFFPRKRAHWVR